MSVSRDIAGTWVAPRRVAARLLAKPPSEARMLAWLMLGLVLFLGARLPGLARQAHLSDGTLPFAGLVAGTALGSLVFAPLLFYGLAALGGLAARAFGAAVPGWAARAALFWAVLAVSPAMLLAGLVAGFADPGPVTTLTGTLAGAAFLVFWVAGLRAAAAHSRAAAV
jgi:hypothetical protein